MNNPTLRTTLAATVLAAGFAMAGCATTAKLSAHLPWAHKPPPAPEVSAALTVAMPDGTALAWPQFWQRNDVVLDLGALSGTGSAVVMPRSGLAWPVRVALRVSPGSFGSIEVRGAQRLVLPVPASGAGTVDLELPPGMYVATTRQMTLSWGPADVPPGK